MFWADRAVEEFLKRHDASGKAGEVIVRDEKTASGHPHVGSLIGVAIHDVVARVLNTRGTAAKFLYEINDTDAMDGLPVYLDESVYRAHMGKQLRSIPAPDGSAANLAEYFAKDFKRVITEAGFTPEFYTLSDVYQSGRMNDVIRTALTKAADIRRIYREVSKSEKADDWLPLNVVCESCGKIATTKVTSFDGEKVTYTCQENIVEWAKGCGHSGTVSPFDGNGTLPWKVEWAAKFKVMNVQVEGAGKDHSTKGGSRDVADRIAREIFSYEPPFNIPYEFLLIGGKKMSSSKGNAATARQVADLLPPQILSLALIGREIERQKNFDPDGDSVPLLFDQYDVFAKAYWEKRGDDEARAFELIHTPDRAHLLEQRFLPRFSQVAFLVQMPHLSLLDEVAKIKGDTLTDADRRELEERAQYARSWLSLHAPEKYKFVIQTDVPESARAFSDAQRNALKKVLAYVEAHDNPGGEAFHHALHAIKEEEGIEPKELFTALYRTFLDRDSGPQAGWFLSTIDRSMLIAHLQEVTS